MDFSVGRTGERVSQLVPLPPLFCLYNCPHFNGSSERAGGVATIDYGQLIQFWVLRIAQ